MQLFLVLVVLLFSATQAQIFTVAPPTGDPVKDLAAIENTLSLGQQWQTNNTFNGIIPQVEIVLSSGTYSLCPSNGTCININNWTNLIFRGDIIGSGTTINLLGPNTGYITVSVGNSVTVSDLTFDMQILPWTQGLIVGTNQTKEGALAFVDVQIESGYLSFNDSFIAYAVATGSGFFQVMDPVFPRVKKNVPSYFYLAPSPAPFLLPDGKTWRLTFGHGPPYWGWTNSTPLIVAGTDRFAFVTRFGNTGIYFDKSTNVAAIDLTFYACGSVVTVASESAGPIVYDRFNVLIKPGTNRLVSSTGGAGNLQNNRGSISVTNSVYQGMADDGWAFASVILNISAIYSMGGNGVIQIHSPRRILVGDQLQILDGSNGRIRGLQIVTAITPSTCSLFPGQHCNITLDFVPIGTVVGDPTYIFNAAGSPVLVANNTFMSHRGHGILLNCPNSLVINNNFSDLTLAGVEVGPVFAGFGIGPVPSNATVQDNTFIGGSVEEGILIDNTWWSAPLLGNNPQIIVTSVLYNSSDPIQQITAATGPSDVTIIGNQIFQPATLSIEVDIGSRISIANNTVTLDPSIPRIPGPAVLVLAGYDITVSPFTLTGVANNITSAVELDCGISVIPEYQCWSISSQPYLPITVCPSWPTNVSTFICPQTTASSSSSSFTECGLPILFLHYLLGVFNFFNN